MPRFRSRRRSSPRTVVQSYKKVLNFAPASLGAGKEDHLLVDGKDSTTSGQTGPTDANVPTGSIITSILIQQSYSNLAATARYINTSVQMLLGGQANTVASTAVGGNDQRNQVFHQELFNVGEAQNANRSYLFKVPKKYQRLREGMKWLFTYNADGTHTRSVQVIYKFYR